MARDRSRPDTESTTCPDTARSAGATTWWTAAPPPTKLRMVNTTPPHHRRGGVMLSKTAGLDATLAAYGATAEALGPAEIALGLIKRQRRPDTVRRLVAWQRKQLAVPGQIHPPVPELVHQRV